MNTIRIATRNSPLARYQAERVGSMLREKVGVRFELLGMTTQGDRQTGSTFAGKGAFVKELETALLEGRADIAVHSMKDVPIVLPDGLAVTTVGSRADVRDALIANDSTFDTLPEGARIGSSSLRRRMQLRFVRPDLTMMDMRGNVGTRLRKLDDGEVDALVLACAGLDRLGLAERISQRLDVDLSLPAPGQGALAVEYRADRSDVLARMAAIIDPLVEKTVLAERTLVRALGGDCATPLGAYAETRGSAMALTALLGDENGEHVLRVSEHGDDPMELGERAAAALYAMGAKALLGQRLE